MKIEIYDTPAHDGSKDYIVQLKIKNGPLLRAIRSRAWTMKSCADRAHIDLNTLYKYLSLRSAPLDKKGQWKGSALKLASAIGLPPDCLWPPDHLDQALAKSTGEFEVSAHEMKLLCQSESPLLPDEMIGRAQLDEAINKALSTLSRREQEVIRARFGLDGDEKTLDQLGENYGLSREGVRAIEKKALLKLKHPMRAQGMHAAGLEYLGLVPSAPAKLTAAEIKQFKARAELEEKGREYAARANKVRQDDKTFTPEEWEELKTRILGLVSAHIVTPIDLCFALGLPQFRAEHVRLAAIELAREGKLEAVPL